MLELTKKILVRVSFDPILFQKELSKALGWIKDSEEVRRLKEWCIKEFGNRYPTIIQTAFSPARS
jgi:coproporphyrinogen III oxidase-like Fe-S oxidoreductase